MLCRFAQFFIKPLMSQDAVLREIKAVDSGEQLLCSVTLMSARHDDFMLILVLF
jgi:secreted Zn-dependent insulinase-like peptidase